MKKMSIVGYFILSFFALFLLSFTTYHVFKYSTIFFIFFLVLLIFLVLSLVKVFINDQVVNKLSNLIKKDNLKEFVAVFLGAIITYLIVLYFKISCVLASSLVGLVGAIIFKRYQAAIFCGSFVGMTSPEVLSILPFVSASLLASLIFILSKDVFNGYGGKLGTIAFSGSLIIAYIFQMNFLNGQIYDNKQKLIIIIASIIASLLTYFLNARMKLGPVLASSIIGLIGSLLFLNIYYSLGPTLATVIFGSSFVGMTSRNKFSSEGFILLAGTLFGLIFIYNSTYFGGVGGRLGATAFVSVLVIDGLIFLIRKIYKIKRYV